ncbi:hypothetical protein ONZ45_g14923 [Pleurotus djamor]|nr:hypothetical protein ONZ45_g14923 [Pleurotus djamor]
MTTPSSLGWVEESERSPWRQFFNLVAKRKDPLKVGDWIDLGADMAAETARLIGTNGHFMVRADYETVYSFLEKCEAAEEVGRVITGSPGIGKSVFLVELYLLIESKVYKFHDAEQFSRSEHLAVLLTSQKPCDNPWALIDSPAQAVSEPPRRLINNDKIFSVFASSPNPIHYGPWINETGAQTLVMDLWTDSDLPLGEGGRPTLTKKEEVTPSKPLYQKYGPCIRDLLKASTTPSSYEDSLDTALIKMHDNLLSTFQSSFLQNSDLPIEILPHTLFIIPRLELQESGERKCIHTVKIKCPLVLQKLCDITQKRDTMENRRRYSAISPFPEMSSLAGVYFEKIAIDMLRLKDKDGAKISVLPMVQLDPRNRNRYTFSRSESSRTAGFEFPAQKCAVKPLPPVNSEVPLLVGEMYVPTARNNPLFDAILLTRRRIMLKTPGRSIESFRVTIWVFQMTISPDHGGSAQGCKLISDYRKHFLKANPKSTCEIKYVLVVPRKQHSKYTWDVPAGVKDVSIILLTPGLDTPIPRTSDLGS